MVIFFTKKKITDSMEICNLFQLHIPVNPDRDSGAKRTAVWRKKSSPAIM